jgi:hypothetical protein
MDGSALPHLILDPDRCHPGVTLFGKKWNLFSTIIQHIVLPVIAK